MFGMKSIVDILNEKPDFIEAEMSDEEKADGEKIEKLFAERNAARDRHEAVDYSGVDNAENLAKMKLSSKLYGALQDIRTELGIALKNYEQKYGTSYVVYDESNQRTR
jgi:hypothetical protein